MAGQGGFFDAEERLRWLSASGDPLERLRVALARAMVRSPSVFLMDEPLSNLDARLRVETRAEIVALHRQLGATFLYVTHDQAEAMTMSDRVALMLDGRLLQVGPPSALYADPAALPVAEFIGTPRINTLPAAVDRDGRVVVVGRRIEMSVAAAGPLTLAIRPEAVQPDPFGRFEGQVLLREDLGSEVLVHLAVPGLPAPMIMRLYPGMAAAAPGPALRFELPPAGLLAFDVVTGQRLRRTAATVPAMG